VQNGVSEVGRVPFAVDGIDPGRGNDEMVNITGLNLQVVDLAPDVPAPHCSPKDVSGVVLAVRAGQLARRAGVDEEDETDGGEEEHNHGTICKAEEIGDPRRDSVTGTTAMTHTPANTSTTRQLLRMN
jgi:hypothetical protein